MENPDKPNILVVGDFNRTDFLNMFRACFSDFNFYFLEFASPNEVTNPYYQHIGKAVFWGDFSCALQLLEKIQPKKVLFIFIESYYHVALNISCKVKGIPTYHIDHGIRDMNVNIRLEKHINDPVTKDLPGRAFQKITQLIPRVKARMFLLKTIRNLPPHEAAALKAYIQIRKRATYRETIKQFNSPYRIADAYISFSPKTHEVHQFYDLLSPDKKVYFIGFPSFDHLASLKPEEPKDKYLIFIDQGLAYRNLYGWSQEKHQAFTRQFSDVCAKYGYSVKVKLHPRQPSRERKNWESIPNTQIVTDEELSKLLPATRIVTGFFSTYHLPVIAMPHTTVLILENHPAGRLDVSKSFIDAGVAYPLYNLENLYWALEHIEQLHQQQLPNKRQFEEEWLYKFDGKAGERLRGLLLSDSL